MDIKFQVDDAETLAQLHGLSVDAYVEAWAEAVRRLARENARSRIGGTFGNQVAESVRQEAHGLAAAVYSVGRIGEHVHQGGPIRSANGRMLAIPSKWNTQKGLFARNWPEDSLQFVRSKQRNRAYLFEKRADGKLGRPMFYLTRQTRPQKPRPWWPEPAEIAAATVKFFDDNF